MPAPRFKHYEVEITPKDALADRDPQPKKAIQVRLEEIKRNIPVWPIKPKYPVTFTIPGDCAVLE